MQGFSKSSAALLQIAKLVIYYLKVKLLGGNPRSLYNAKYTMQKSQWGTSYPAQLLLAVIALSYSTIAPFVVGFACFAFATYYFTYKYMALFCWDITPDAETAGMFFKTALNQLFAGIYIYCLCLIGLFFLSEDSNGNRSAAPQGGIMVALLIVCIAFQIWLNWKLKPTSVYLDTKLADETRANERRYAQEMRSSSEGMRPMESRTTERTAIGTGNAAAAAAGQKTGKVSTDMEGGARDVGDQDAEMAGGLDDNAFLHPALWRDQPTVWLPRDKLGISQQAVERGHRRNVLITDEHASINEKGKVDIDTDELPGEDFKPNL